MVFWHEMAHTLQN